MRIFWKNTVKIASALGVPPPNNPFASGGWKLHPQTPASLLSPTITTLSSSCLALNAFHYSLKKIQWLLQCMFCFCFFRTFAPIFCFKLCRFYDEGRKNISFPKAQGILIATPLTIGFNFFRFLSPTHFRWRRPCLVYRLRGKRSNH